MPSKTSKPSPKALSRSREERACSEERICEIAAELASQILSASKKEGASSCHVLLEGPMGSGKTTFARALLHSLGVSQPPEGSPTFAIAHEYESKLNQLPVAHLDLYRFKSESELEDAGIPAYFWEKEGVVIAEWVSLWAGIDVPLWRGKPIAPVWRVSIGFHGADPGLRDLKIEFKSPSGG